MRERGHTVVEVAGRLGITTHSLYQWLRKFGKAPAEVRAEADQAAELRRLKAEVRRLTEERDILKKGSSWNRVGTLAHFHSSGSMQVSTFKRRYSSSRRP